MKKTFWSLMLAIFTCGFATAQSLVKVYDFNQVQGPGLTKEFFANGGKASLFTEEYTWNKCGRYEIEKIHDLEDGHKGVNQTLIIGHNGKNVGFDCKPNKTYSLSIDLKGSVPSASVGLYFWGAESKSVYSYKNAKPVITKPTDEWVNLKAEFKTGPEATRAAIYLQFWATTKLGPLKYKIGDYLLFDNIVVEEVEERSLLALAADAAQKPKISIRKLLSSVNQTFSDFGVFKTNASPNADTIAAINADDKGIHISVDCHEPLKVVEMEDNLWNGDTLEIFFEGIGGDRAYTQFVVSPNNKTFTSKGTMTQVDLKWEHKAEKSATGWKAQVFIPFEQIGWKNPQSGERIGINIGRQRKAANELITWSPVITGFNDTKNYGQLIIGAFPGNQSREQFEKADAERIAAEQDAKLQALASAPFLIAKVKLSDDNSIPYLPKELFNPIKNFSATAAINETKIIPIALFNNTNMMQIYRVTLEPPESKNWQGTGPKAFPGSTIRQCMPVRDSAQATSTLFDLAPRINEASCVTIPAKTAMLLLICIDTQEMLPGLQEGLLRVIPMTGKGALENGYWKATYKGEMQKIPFQLNILDIVLPTEPDRYGMFFSAIDSNTLPLTLQIGVRCFKMCVWNFSFPLKDGKFVPSAPKADSILANAYKMGLRRMVVSYSAVYVFKSTYGEKNLHLFGDWVKEIANCIKKHGYDLSLSSIELYDEPPATNLEEIIATARMAQEKTPELPVAITLGAHIMSPDTLVKFSTYVDEWILWRYGYFSRPEHLDFFRQEQKAGKRISHYTCATSPRTSVHDVYRLNSWFGEAFNLDFNSMYQLLDERAGANWVAPTTGDIILRMPEGAVPTLRYMGVLQGANDVKYLQKLRSLNNEEGKEFLKTAAKRVIENQFNKDMPDIVREETAQLILKIKKEQQDSGRKTNESHVK